MMTKRSRDWTTVL
ncbi:unnamed protein product [Oikopleura dioica]|uniref:Uncharacterized protein n=1 Tax=Oikopleura dioica TaxID=34765 RepID=E4XYS8_OIKDI|nr:unnamed protein product [Oikopleura dioica]